MGGGENTPPRWNDSDDDGRQTQGENKRDRVQGKHEKRARKRSYDGDCPAQCTPRNKLPGLCNAEKTCKGKPDNDSIRLSV